MRDPIKRILSHWVHATGAGYETRELVPTLSEPDSSYIQRSMYWMQLQPYLELFDRAQIEVIAQEELQSEREETMRKAFRFAGVDESFTSEQFDREWEKSSAKQGDKYQVMEKLVKLPGLRSFDRNFDRLPESLRWIVEKVVHDPEKPPAPKPKLPDDLFETVRGRFGADVAGPAGVRRPRVRRLARLLTVLEVPLNVTSCNALGSARAAPTARSRHRPRSRSSSTPTGPGRSRAAIGPSWR